MDKKDQLTEHIQNAGFFAARQDWVQCILALDEAMTVAEELKDEEAAP